MTKTTLAFKDKHIEVRVSGLISEKIAHGKNSIGNPSLVPPYCSGMMPMAIRWISSYGPAVCLERPPEQRLISFHGKQFQLWFPWLTHWLVFSPGDLRLVQASIFARTSPVDGRQSHLFQLPIPNQYADATFCLPPDALGQTHETLGAAVDFAYHTIWSSPFNPEVNEMIDRNHRIFTGRAKKIPTSTILKMYEAWETKSLDEVIQLPMLVQTAFSTVANDINNFFLSFMTGAALYQHIVGTARTGAAAEQKRKEARAAASQQRAEAYKTYLEAARGNHS